MILNDSKEKIQICFKIMNTKTLVYCQFTKPAHVFFHFYQTFRELTLPNNKHKTVKLDKKKTEKCSFYEEIFYRIDSCFESLQWKAFVNIFVHKYVNEKKMSLLFSEPFFHSFLTYGNHSKEILPSCRCCCNRCCNCWS